MVKTENHEVVIHGISSHFSFLKDVVILLVDSKKNSTVELLINHFIRKKEKRDFYCTLPRSVSARLKNQKAPLLKEAHNG